MGNPWDEVEDTDDERWVWTEEKRRACWHLAEGLLSITEIAKDAGTHRQTIWNWRHKPEFRAQLKEFRQRLADEVYEHGIADKQVRLALLAQRERQLRRLVAAEPDNHAVLKQYRGILHDAAREVGARSAFADKGIYEQNNPELQRPQIVEVRVGSLPPRDDIDDPEHDLTDLG